MKSHLIASAVVLAIACGAGVAQASESPNLNVPKDQWMSIAQISDKFKTEGYDVRQVKIEKGVYEVYALDKDGKRIEALVHPATGEIIGSEMDDDD
ncbi:PepSY domain-containing protein [Nitratireductor indicus]|uniref:Signal peptide protein n=1 Tax=Nitratireductor indicus C115 TaxID=1231190 RepID=K2N7V8_9HYPH|nr:PepSY domain-containing protein [Nitratireductor indicus]EKF43553.1 signal peptide protein [Nitratireductor indicus C115]MDS1135867.1 PepSY domain-containing protein [Nitratireductor indicus]SFQ05022.1 hypothetical protein SAMN05216176_101111 [Nitratireductor indicus]